MKKYVLILVVALGATIAHADDASCVKKADLVLANVAKTLSMGNGVGHIGGSEVLKRAKDANGNLILTIGGGMLAADDTDGYLVDTDATVEMVETKNGCEVASISVGTGAAWAATLEKEEQK